MMIFFCEKKNFVYCLSDPLPEMIYSGYLLIRRQIEVLSVEYLNDLHPKHKIYMFSGLVHVFSFSVFVCL